MAILMETFLLLLHLNQEKYSRQTGSKLKPKERLHHKGPVLLDSIMWSLYVWIKDESFTVFLQSHYSIKKAGAALGFGSENVILLSTDERWIQSPDKCSKGVKYRICTKWFPNFFQCCIVFQMFLTSPWKILGREKKDHLRLCSQCWLYQTTAFWLKNI